MKEQELKGAAFVFYIWQGRIYHPRRGVSMATVDMLSTNGALLDSTASVPDPTLGDMVSMCCYVFGTSFFLFHLSALFLAGVGADKWGNREHPNHTTIHTTSHTTSHTEDQEAQQKMLQFQTMMHHHPSMMDPTMMLNSPFYQISTFTSPLVPSYHPVPQHLSQPLPQHLMAHVPQPSLPQPSVPQHALLASSPSYQLQAAAAPAAAPTAAPAAPQLSMSSAPMSSSSPMYQLPPSPLPLPRQRHTTLTLAP